MAPPPQPTYILRGHSAALHAMCFLRNSSRLVTADADGWVVVWSLLSKRAVAVWRPHSGTVLGVAEWKGGEGVVTHGKDNKLIVWKLRAEDEEGLSVVLPVDDVVTERKQPWLLHLLHVNSLNFCAFGMCEEESGPAEDGPTEGGDLRHGTLLAVPNALTSEAVDIFHLPSERRVHTVLGDKAVNTGMVMAVEIFYQASRLTILVGYESGHAMLSQETPQQGWQILYLSQSHKQPVLSLNMLPNKTAFFTSSADAVIAKHPVPEPAYARPPSLSTKSQPGPSGKPSALSESFAQKSSQSSCSTNSFNSPSIARQTTPLKQVQTKHSGQQGLTIRSDGKIFATAGWDRKVRVYSTASMKELAVLKWHTDGVYAIALADVRAADDAGLADGHADIKDGEDGGMQVAKKEMRLNVREKRVKLAETTHWLAAGSKDGKVSLWDIY